MRQPSRVTSIALVRKIASLEPLKLVEVRDEFLIFPLVCELAMRTAILGGTVAVLVVSMSESVIIEMLS